MLAWTAARGRTEIARLLVESGADVKRADHSGNTPVMWAAGSGDLDLLRYLIDQGADPLAQERQDRWIGWTALTHAAHSGQIPALEWLIHHYGLGQDGGATALIAATKVGQAGAVQFLLDSGVDPNLPSKGFYGRAALAYAAWNGNKALCRLLLERGAQVTTVVRNLAMSAGRYRTLQLLERGGA